MSEQSRWFIKDKPLEEKIKACKKSLEAAQRSGRANIAKALEEKLVKLLDEQSPASKPKAVKGGAAKGKNTKRPKKAPTPREAKEIPLKKKKETPRSASSKATHSANQPIQPSKQTKKTKTMKATRADEASASAPQAFRKLRKKVTTTQEPEKVKKKLKKKSQGSGNDHQTAIDLLLRAAAKAKAARAAAGEESEEEALMPDLPPAKCFTSMTADDGEPGFGEDDGHPNSTTGAEEEDDFFDAVEDPLVDRPEAPDTEESQVRSLRGEARREKKLRRQERLERIRQERLQKHPSWVAAQKCPKVNGSMLRQKSGRRTKFDSDSEASANACAA